MALAVVGLFSCKEGKPITYDLEIPERDQREMFAIRQRVFNAFLNHNADSLVDIYSKEMSPRNILTIDSMVRLSKLLPNFDSTVLLRECRINSRKDSVIREISGTVRGYDYIYRFNPLSHNTYISLWTALDSSRNNTVLFAMLFNLEKEKWKLFSISIGHLLINNESSEDKLIRSVEFLNKGKLLPATYFASLGYQLMFPAMRNFHYRNEDQMTYYTKNIADSANKILGFPRILSNISTAPTIYLIGPHMYRDRVYPTITYVTKIARSDSSNMVSENNKIDAIRETIFEDVSLINDTILYKILSRDGHQTFILKTH